MKIVVSTYVCYEWNSKTEKKCAKADGEESSVLQKFIGPVINNSCDKSFNVTKFTVNTENQKHQKEYCCP